jgi:hypothetical protein
VRVNAAAELIQAGIPTVEAAGVLAAQWGVSTRQARRYVERAASGGPVQVPEASVVFTVKLPASLAERVRRHAHDAGLTISGLVAGALWEFLERGRRQPRRR